MKITITSKGRFKVGKKETPIYIIKSDSHMYKWAFYAGEGDALKDKFLFGTPDNKPAAILKMKFILSSGLIPFLQNEVELSELAA